MSNRYKRSRQLFQNGNLASSARSVINNAINSTGGSTSATVADVPSNSSIPVSQMPMGFRPKEYEVQVKNYTELFSTFRLNRRLLN